MGGEAQDAFIIFDEAYEGNDVDAFYLGDILRALGCNVTNAAVAAHGGAEALGEKLEGDEADKLCDLLGLVADEEDMIPYMEFIDKLLAQGHEDVLNLGEGDFAGAVLVEDLQAFNVILLDSGRGGVGLDGGEDGAEVGEGDSLHAQSL